MNVSKDKLEEYIGRGFTFLDPKIITINGVEYYQMVRYREDDEDQLMESGNY